MNFIKRNIPNAITCGNLLCGCLAIVKAFEGNLVWAAYLVGIAAVLDFFDGFAARLLKVSSPIGKDLDSLADMVTFGVVPGIIMFQFITLGVFEDDYFKTKDVLLGITNWQPPFYLFYLKYFAFFIPIFSCIRLAKFNNDLRQSDSFIGLPTPANAIFISSLPLIVNFSGYNVLENMAQIISSAPNTINEMEFREVLIQKAGYVKLILNPYFLVVLSLSLSVLLVAELPLFSLKFKHFKWKGNEIRFVFLLLSVVMLVLLKFLGIPLIIIFYILLSVVSNIINKKKVA